MGAEPEDEYLLPAGEQTVADGDVEAERERHEPQQHAQPGGRQGKGRDDQGERRAVVVQVKILLGVVYVERQTVDDVPVYIFEDQEIVLATMTEAGHSRDGIQSHSRVRGSVRKIFSFSFIPSYFVCKGTNLFGIFQIISYLCSDERRK